MISFGTLIDLPGAAFARSVKDAEDRGFDYAYFVDSPMNWSDLSINLTLAAERTTRIKLGACVTNPLTRHPVVSARFHAALNEHTGGRVILGLGKGDSALRQMGERPERLADFKKKALFIKQLAEGREVTYEARTPSNEDWYVQGQSGGKVAIRLKGVDGKHKLPLYVAGYGPKILRWAGGHADGVFLQTAEPDSLEWLIGHVRKGADEAGRDFSEIDIVSCTMSMVSDDLHEACNFARGFPAFISNHMVDLLRFTDRSELPPSMLRCVEGKTTYDYREHAQSGAKHAEAYDDETVQMYAIVGSAEQCAEKIDRLGKLGVTQICLYGIGMSEEQAKSMLDDYSGKVMPKLSAGSSR